MLFKNWKIAKIRQISSIFHKKIENFEFDFCTYHERSNFGIKKSDFFFGVENFTNILRLSTVFYHYFKRILGGGVSLRPKWIHLTRLFLICDFLRRYGQNTLKLCRIGQNTMLIVKLTPNLVLPTNFSKQSLKAIEWTPIFIPPPTQSTFLKPSPPPPPTQHFLVLGWGYKFFCRVGGGGGV